MLHIRHRLALRVLFLSLASAAWLSTAVADVPEPDIVTDQWQLDLSYRELNIIPIRRQLEAEPQYFYYMVFKVTNKTGSDRLFAPDIWMMTDAGDLMLSNSEVPSAVFRAIKARVKNPLLEAPSQVVGKLLQGSDNARESVAIWPAPKHDVNDIRVFVGGLSGETHRMHKVTEGGDTNLRPGTYIPLKDLEIANAKVKAANDSIKSINPDAGDTDLKKEAVVEQLPVVMRKTLQIDYHTPGDETHVGEKPFVFKAKDWVIR